MSGLILRDDVGFTLLISRDVDCPASPAIMELNAVEVLGGRVADSYSFSIKNHVVLLTP
jgi:hypothetical protein